MFNSAVIKLTAGYIGAITLICLIFSIPVYVVVSDRMRTGAERQAEFIGRIYRPGQPVRNLPDLVRSRDSQLASDRRQLLSGLVIINLCIIAVGGYLSYLFAKQTLRPIKDAHQLQKEFTANASHELRTPLAVIQAESEVALRNKKLTLANAKKTITSNLEEVSRLQDISSQLLSLTRIEPNKTDFQRADIVALVKAEIGQYTKTSRGAIELKAPPTAYARADSTLLRQAVGILLDNAIKYSAGVQKPKLLVEVKKSRQHVAIKVTDNGVGIARDDQPKVFDRFFRGKNATKDPSKNGNGLGLAIARQIVKQHGGVIALDKSTPGKGSTFSVRLPV